MVIVGFAYLLHESYRIALSSNNLIDVKACLTQRLVMSPHSHYNIVILVLYIGADPEGEGWEGMGGNNPFSASQINESSQ